MNFESADILSFHPLSFVDTSFEFHYHANTDLADELPFYPSSPPILTVDNYLELSVYTNTDSADELTSHLADDSLIHFEYSIHTGTDSTDESSFHHSSAVDLPATTESSVLTNTDTADKLLLYLSSPPVDNILESSIHTNTDSTDRLSFYPSSPPVFCCPSRPYSMSNSSPSPQVSSDKTVVGLISIELENGEKITCPYALTSSSSRSGNNIHFTGGQMTCVKRTSKELIHGNYRIPMPEVQPVSEHTSNKLTPEISLPYNRPLYLTSTAPIKSWTIDIFEKNMKERLRMINTSKKGAKKHLNLHHLVSLKQKGNSIRFQFDSCRNTTNTTNNTNISKLQ
eukprot:TRINITY_DN13977_c0_g1_i1.p1 TRINITY_DN13977_c0_g1~~TRINITY_DN13977_c0_g1_i1.p1  ORF type:complete len:340 (-),score=45.15 TRINITY_DN13977_c0_g1_i1:32-1051(-)